MSPDKDAALCAKYPKIFRDRNAPMTQTCMCWGFECGDGWYDLIDTLCAEIQNRVDWSVEQQKYKLEDGRMKPEDVVPEDDLQVVAAQVKEKFGGLRFYVNGGTEEIYGMISMAESMSYKICEECGNPGRPNRGGWITTLCSPCRAAEEAKKEAARIEWENRTKK